MHDKKFALGWPSGSHGENKEGNVDKRRRRLFILQNKKKYTYCAYCASINVKVR